MSAEINKTNKNRKGPDGLSRIFHLCLAVLGILAFSTGDGADDYRKLVHDGFDLHKWLGIGVAATIALRLIYGLAGPESARFLRWTPYTRERLSHAWDGMKSLVTWRRPDRQGHTYVAGLVKSFGLILFTWMAATGSYIFFFLEPGTKPTGLVRMIKEMHEVGESLIPVYLTLHIGAVLVHALYGRHIWRPMVFMRR